MKVQVYSVEKLEVSTTDFKDQPACTAFRTIEIHATDKDGVITTITFFVKPGFVPDLSIKPEAE